MSYILNMLICVGMILLHTLLQYLLFIDVIDVSRTCDSTVILICNALVMFIMLMTKFGKSGKTRPSGFRF
jgi:hypothetical protein